MTAMVATYLPASFPLWLLPISFFFPISVLLPRISNSPSLTPPYHSHSQVSPPPYLFLLPLPEAPLCSPVLLLHRHTPRLINLRILTTTTTSTT